MVRGYLGRYQSVFRPFSPLKRQKGNPEEKGRTSVRHRGAVASVGCVKPLVHLAAGVAPAVLVGGADAWVGCDAILGVAEPGAEPAAFLVSVPRSTVAGMKEKEEGLTTPSLTAPRMTCTCLQQGSRQ